MGNYWFPVASFLLCLVLTPLVRRHAHNHGWIAHPTKDRWHKRPTALAGGIAIYASVAIPLFFMADFSTLIPHFSRNSIPAPLPSIDAVVWVGASFLFLLGLWDDFFAIKPHTKLVGQILTASLVAFFGFRLHWLESMTLDTTLTILWIIGITNAFNLLDNMDGLCAGIGSIAALYVSLLVSNIMPEAGIAATILFAASTAFLFYNFNPASIFMGDSGSLLIGFTVAVLSLCYSHAGSGNGLSSVAVPILLLMVPIFDTTLVTLIRILSGRKASTGGRDHTSHRLVLMGFSERGAVLFLYCIAGVSGLSSIFVHTHDTLTSPVVIVPVALSFILMGVYLAQLRVYPEEEFSILRNRSYTPILIELTYKRQLVLVMLDFFLIGFVYYVSYRLRFDAPDFPFYFKIFLLSLPAVIACKYIAFFSMGIYRGIWGFMGMNDVYACLKASTFASLLSVAAVTFIYRFENFSKGIFIIDWLLTTGFLVGTRGSFRLFSETMKRKTLSGDAVLIYGAGRGGEILLREIINNQNLRIKPVGFVDDDILKMGKKLQGYPILGTGSQIEELLPKHRVDGLLISFRNQGTEKMEAIRKLCRKNNLFLKQFTICLEPVPLETGESRASGLSNLSPGLSPGLSPDLSPGLTPGGRHRAA
jgi:UDP-GlcNAc:undecaprenyl-phosphate GlcNAc-1-phosphate transferase